MSRADIQERARLLDQIDRLEVLFGSRFHLDTQCGSCGGPLECDRDAICHRCTDAMKIERLRAELESAQAELELPKTRDGEIIVLGRTKLWARDDYSDPPRVFRLGVAISLTVGVAMGPPRVMADRSQFVACDQTYSTREAAEKARDAE